MLRGELRFTGDIPEALEQAQALARPGDLICVTGSLFVVGAARETLGIAAVCD
jgi:dihydrofolate synthase/folylpolyglutamate synthase